MKAVSARTQASTRNDQNLSNSVSAGLALSSRNTPGIYRTQISAEIPVNINTHTHSRLRARCTRGFYCVSCCIYHLENRWKTYHFPNPPSSISPILQKNSYALHIGSLAVSYTCRFLFSVVTWNPSAIVKGEAVDFTVSLGFLQIDMFNQTAPQNE